MMRMIVATAAVMTILAAGLAAVRVRAGEESDRDRIQGTWIVSAGAKAGQKAPPEALEGLTLTFDGDAFTWTAGGGEHRGTFKLDPTRSPRQITLSTGELSLAGIYRLQGDELSIRARHGDERPADFADDDGTDLVLTLRRRKP